MNKNTISNNLLLTKIRATLTDLGLSEIYQSFNYLTDLIYYMIVHNDDSIVLYKKAISIISNKNSVTERNITNAISNILKSCDERLNSKLQFQLTRNRTLNKVRVIKNHILNEII